MPHIFVSYSRKDIEIVGKVVNALRGSGYIIWQDVEGIPLGSIWMAQLENAHQSADAILVMWSQNAAQSSYVEAEIEVAQKQEKIIIPVSIDGEDFTKHQILKNYQGLKMIPFESGLEKLKTQLIAEQIVKPRQPQNFNLHEPIRLQSGAESYWEVDGIRLFRVPFIYSGYSKAFIVAAADTTVGNPKTVQLCLQVSRGVNDPFIPDVYRAVRDRTIDFDPSQFIAAWVVGPISGENYRLDSDNEAQWTDVVDTAFQTMQILSVNGRPRTQIFNLGTVALATALGTKFYRFWHLELFQYDSGKYKKVIEVMPE